MQSSSRFRDWYTDESKGSNSDPAGDAFKAAIQLFSNDLTHDDRKRAMTQGVSDLEDLRSIVSTAEKKYVESQRPARKWILKFSQRIHHYGAVLDVIAQHHPEYVALAWGAMKFLFTAVINHEALVTALSRGLAKIAFLLPRSELITSLYPTQRMITAVSELYAIIIRFLIRAKDWLQESRFTRAIHSITRPAELRYADLIEEIELRSENVSTLATAASQAEIRDMRLEILDMRGQQQESNALIKELKQIVIQNHSVSLNQQLDTNNRLSDLQLSQILASLSSPLFVDPIRSLQHGVHQRNKRRSKTQNALTPFWLANKFRAWARSDESSLVIVKGRYNLRTQLRDFSTNFLQLVFAAEVPIVWVVKSAVDEEMKVTAIDMLRYLTWQVLSIGTSQQSERNMALNTAKFHSARTEEDWFRLLATVLANLQEVFVVVDTELVHPDFAPLAGNFSFGVEFLKVFQRLKEHSVGNKVKVLLITYGEMRFCRPQEGKENDNVIDVGRPGNSGGIRNQRKALLAQKRGPMGQVFPTRTLLGR